MDKETMSDKQAHLQMIQAIITRMANNSFLIKGWSVLIISAIMAIAVKDDQALFIPVAFFPALVLWGLDGYFLRQERLFRKLYEKVTGIAESEIDFSMNIMPVLKQVDSWLKVSFSSTLFAFHGAIIVSVIAIGIVSCFLL